MRYSSDEVSKHLRDQEDTQVSVAQYCKAHDISIPTFYYWRRKHRTRTRAETDVFAETANKVELIASDVFTRLQPIDSFTSCVLTTPGGSRIELGELRPDELARFVRILETTDV